jgi:hypothetical protein
VYGKSYRHGSVRNKIQIERFELRLPFTRIAFKEQKNRNLAISQLGWRYFRHPGASILLLGLGSRPICLDFRHQAHLSTCYTGRRPSRLAPFRKLKANCLNMASMLFLIMVVKRARLRSSNKVAMPKYCSTIYRFLEICLFRAISV